MKHGAPLWRATWDILSTAGLVHLVALYFNPYAIAPNVDWLWGMAAAVAVSELAGMWRARPLLEAELAVMPAEARPLILRGSLALTGLYYASAALLIIAALSTRT